jgi:hypothetical protein
MNQTEAIRPSDVLSNYQPPLQRLGSGEGFGLGSLGSGGGGAYVSWLAIGFETT